MATGTLGVCHYGGTWCPSVAGGGGEFFASESELLHGHGRDLLGVNVGEEFFTWGPPFEGPSRAIKDTTRS